MVSNTGLIWRRMYSLVSTGVRWVSKGSHRMGWSLGLKYPTTGGSTSEGRNRRAPATLSRTSWATMSRSVPRTNSTVTIDVP
jgi:hypothetical protein